MTEDVELASAPRGLGAFEHALSAVFVVILVLCAAATVGVMSSRMPPLFNQDARVYKLANIACLMVLSATAAILIITGTRKRLLGVRRALLIALVTLSIVEALLFLFDRYSISAAGSPNPWAFRNVWIHGSPIWLPQPSPDSPLGLHNLPASSSQQAAYRVLFLGSSFVHGSGSSFDTNYPQVVAAQLRAALPEKDVSVFSAGVDGFGPKENRLLYEYLLELGYKFDLVVVNFNLGSDLNIDIPDTLRKSVAGESQRFPENRFLELFYPVDTYLFRYAYYFQITFNPRFGKGDESEPGDATCKPTTAFVSYARQRTWLYYGPGAEERLYADYNLAELFRIKDVATAHGSQAVVVLLPDRFGVLPIPMEVPADHSLDRTWTRKYLQDKIGARLPMLDLTPYFENRLDLFACNDLHWNDAGNIEGAHRVSDYLAKVISSTPTSVSPHIAATP